LKYEDPVNVFQRLNRWCSSFTANFSQIYKDTSSVQRNILVTEPQYRLSFPVTWKSKILFTPVPQSTLWFT